MSKVLVTSDLGIEKRYMRVFSSLCILRNPRDHLTLSTTYKKMSDLSHIERLHTHDLELGATEAIQKHYERHVVSTKAVSQRKLDFERSRPRWLREMMAEATGVFFYGVLDLQMSSQT
jgi:hypothetical protein